MAVKPYQEGAVWSFRLRLKGQSLYRTGFASAAKARCEAERLRQKILESGKPKHEGPWQATFAEALQRYALERLPNLKGGRQDANRINRYLRAAGLATVVATPLGKGEGGNAYFKVALEVSGAARKVPKGLHGHRAVLEARTQATERLVRRLAMTQVADVAPHQIQELIDTMVQEGYSPASIALERALIRQLFNYAKNTWLWVEPSRNPAIKLTLPKVDNARERVLTNAEWEKVSQELQKARSPYVAPAIALLLETAMRVSEPLLNATWESIDWQSSVLHLDDAKAGARDVPLGPGAVEILQTLNRLRLERGGDDRILPISYELLKAAWRRACKAAGVEDVHIHDLRHTAATRYTLELNGNLPILKVITGHKTYSQLSRYINVKPDDVSRLLHGRPLTEEGAPAGMHVRRAALVPASRQVGSAMEDLPNNVVPLASRRRG